MDVTRRNDFLWINEIILHILEGEASRRGFGGLDLVFWTEMLWVWLEELGSSDPVGESCLASPLGKDARVYGVVCYGSMNVCYHDGWIRALI